MDNTLEQLARYVYQQLQQDVSERNIRAALAQNRWTQDWIDAVFNVVHQNPTMFNAPSIQPLQRNEAIRPAYAASPTSIDAKLAAQSTTAAPAQPKKDKKLPLILLGVGAALLVIVVGAYLLLSHPKRGAQQATTPAANAAQEEPKQAKSPDEKRKDDLNTLLSGLTGLYVANKFYPTYDTLKSKEFADQNPTFDTKAFADPKWSANNAACTDKGRAIMSARPTPFCYAYSVTTSEGAACDNIKLFCTRMTVVTTFDSGSPYLVTLDRNTQIDN